MAAKISNWLGTRSQRSHLSAALLVALKQDGSHIARAALKHKKWHCPEFGNRYVLYQFSQELKICYVEQKNKIIFLFPELTRFQSRLKPALYLNILPIFSLRQTDRPEFFLILLFPELTRIQNYLTQLYTKLFYTY